ncbi:YdeI/OmpD-associated family protein [Nocardioides sp. BP30]|uniref:YdeI/OmpD-associated family protein n=1 Tax=Nocardioides sp. BP30 TaxID=3036374 RepID=UPI002468B9A1|nr:YdeI/OmpD-associated family protein [Nocardioides sp. BP30]WGL50481.1 YdeI/OmpD-associated family protein [Nocardioides sp. BP30]
MAEIVIAGAELVARGPAAAFVLTAEQVDQVGGGRKRFPVVLTAGGRTWRGSVASMGGEFLIGLSKQARAEAGLAVGDIVDLTVATDEAPREVEVPPALAEALAADAVAAAAYERLAFTHRKEFARWVGEAKREETRERRVQEALAMLREGRTRS